MPATDLCYLGLVEVGQQIHAKKLSPVEVTRAMLDRIERLDGRLKSYAYVMADSALAEAAVAEKEVAAGKIKGPLHGVPVAIKDLCWVKGAPAAHGMTIHREFRPNEDATVFFKPSAGGTATPVQLYTPYTKPFFYPDFDGYRTSYLSALGNSPATVGSNYRNYYSDAQRTDYLGYARYDAHLSDRVTWSTTSFACCR